MNPDVSNEDVYRAICCGYDTFNSGLTGSHYIHNRDVIAMGSISTCGVQVNFELKSKLQPDGEFVFATTGINYSNFDQGNMALTATVQVSGERPFQMHWHGAPHTGPHVQRGRHREFIPFETGSTFGDITSDLFMQNIDEEEALNKINNIREDTNI